MKSRSPISRSIKEDAEHFIAKCQACTLQRMQVFGVATSTLEYIVRNFNVNTFIKYINATGRLEDDYVCYYIE